MTKKNHIETIILGIDPGTAQTGFGVLSFKIKQGYKCPQFTPTKKKTSKAENDRQKFAHTREQTKKCLECSEIRILTSGSIKTDTNSDAAERLNFIFDEIGKIIKKHQPTCLAIESLFFNSNAVSASAVGQAIGVVKLACHRHGLKITDYPPLRIKMKLLGNGRAEKKAVQEEVRRVLKLEKIPKPTHAADALAAALCYWFDFNSI